MTAKTRLQKIAKTAASRPAQDAGPQIDEVRVYDETGVHVYATDAEARAAHSWLDDPAVCLSVIVPDADEKGQKRT